MSASQDDDNGTNAEPLAERAECALRKSEAKLRSIIDHAPALISTKDLDGKISLVNRAMDDLDGPALDDYVGRTVFELFPREVANALWHDDLAAREAKVEAEETLQHRDGTQHTYLTLRFPLLDERGGLLGTGAISTDITERKRSENERFELERRIRRVEKLESLGIMAGGIAHDFNNLLNVIMGNAELALQDLPEASPTHTLIVECQNAAERAAGLSRQ